MNKKERIMELKPVEDVVRFAIQKEETSVQFYLDLAKQMEDPTTKIIFEILSAKKRNTSPILNWR
jgi:rubrerythrin